MTNQYTSTAKALHWLMAILLFGLLALGFYMHDLPLSPEKLQLYSWHKWAGVSAFLLVLVRLGWRVKHIPPALPASMPKLMQLSGLASCPFLICWTRTRNSATYCRPFIKDSTYSSSPP